MDAARKFQSECDGMCVFVIMLADEGARITLNASALQVGVDPLFYFVAAVVGGVEADTQ